MKNSEISHASLQRRLAAMVYDGLLLFAVTMLAGFVLVPFMGSVELKDDSATVLVDYEINQESNPWRYNDGGEILGGYGGDIGYTTWDDPLGDRHNAVSVDIGFLSDYGYKEFLVHSTLECGNDNLMGSTAPVPEPATMFLFGTGMMGMAFFGRKKFRK